MTVNWVGVYNRLWLIIGPQESGCYFSGPHFLDKVREINLDLPGYDHLMESRRRSGRSTSRKDYFYDVLMDLDEPTRWRAVNAILDEIEHCNSNLAAEIRAIMGGPGVGPTAKIPADLWNAERLSGFLAEIDSAIAAGQYGRAVTLAYTCLEGFYKAFSHSKAPEHIVPNEIIALSRLIRDHLRASMPDCPDEVMNLVTQTSHAVDRARNRFSEAHFGGETGRWLAVYIRDVVNSQIRLLLHFM